MFLRNRTQLTSFQEVSTPSSLLNNSLWWNGPKFLTTKDFPEKNTLSSVTDNDEFNCEFKNKDGVLRVGGRLCNSDLNFECKFPVILPCNHKLTNLIVEYFHLKILPSRSTGLTISRANAELKRLYKLVINPDPELAGFLVDENMNWKFLPPRAPNFGGLWEAGVKSFKFHFKRERVNNLLVHVSEEELNTYSANVFYELLKPERIKIKDSQLLLVNSVFGYIVTGNLDSINETKVHCGLIRDEDLNKTLEKFWKVEEPIVKNKERLICEEHYANTHFRTNEGKYVVSMPLKKEPSCLGNSKDIALKRLGSLWNRLARDDNYLNLYREFLRDYERLGHMKEVTNETEPEIAYYATHHGIYRPEKSTTKLRVVFNCSSLTDSGISLNDIQYNGGVIQEDLYAQMH
ncbi:uncharacterized protein TNCV_4508321 [Trichonephila clavipes]|nr:uncharacterized protein TNCV_4508321 [Trichonephila clavipes]